MLCKTFIFFKCILHIIACTWKRFTSQHHSLKIVGLVLPTTFIEVTVSQAKEVSGHKDVYVGKGFGFVYISLFEF